MTAAAASHVHLPARDPRLAEAAAAALTAQGVAWTDLRADVFATLAEAGNPLSAYEVAERLSARTGRRIAANTVYRILDLFVVHNLAKRIESRNAYLANTHPACVHDCIFLLCDSCGAISHVDDDALADSIRVRASATGFCPERPVMEVRGRCADCADISAAK